MGNPNGIKIVKERIMKLENKKLIIFDFDGTLIDSAPDLTEAVNYMREKLHMEPVSIESVRLWIGNGASKLVKRALCSNVVVDKEKFNEEVFTKALGYFFDHYSLNVAKHTTLYEGVEETLDELKEKKYSFAIATNKPHEFIEPILEKFELKSYFKLYLGGNSVEKKKPDPMMLLRICEELGHSVEESVMIGDSKNDILSAKNANMDSIAMTYGYNYDEDIKIYEPNIICDKFKQLNEVL